MAVACASRAGGREIDGPGLALGGLLTEAELAVADQLVQLSGSGGGDEAADPESPRSVNTCAGAAAWEEREEVAAAGPGLRTMELMDRRARKRYRLLSDLYASTRQVTGADAGNANANANANAGKRKRGHEPEAEMGMTMRCGDQCF